MKLNKKFKYWFFGFIEGLNFLFSAYREEESGGEEIQCIVDKKKCVFIIIYSDLNVLNYIKKNLGFGKITRYGKRFKYRVSNLKDIEKLLIFFSGNLYDYSFLKDWLEFPFFKKFPFKRVKKELVLNDSWLSGYLDVNSKFGTKIVIDQNKKYLESYCYVNGTFEFLKDLIFLFGDNQLLIESQTLRLYFYTIDESLSVFKKFNNLYEFSFISKKRRLSLFKYLSKYPLKTNKRVDYLKFKKFVLENDSNVKQIIEFIK